MDLLAAFAAGFFAGPFWGWGLFVLLIACDAALLESEHEGFAFFSLLVAGQVIAWVAFDTNPAVWVWNNPVETVRFFFGYFIIGAGYSVFKWWRYLLKIRQRARKDVETLHRLHDASKPPESPRRPRESYARYNKGRISTWIGLWPISAIGTIFGDFLLKIVTRIYDALSEVYERISKRVFDGFEDNNDGYW